MDKHKSALTVDDLCTIQDKFEGLLEPERLQEVIATVEQALLGKRLKSAPKELRHAMHGRVINSDGLNQDFEKWFLTQGQPAWELERYRPTNEYVFSHVEFAWKTWVYCFQVFGAMKYINDLQHLALQLKEQAKKSQSLAATNGSTFHAGASGAYHDIAQRMNEIINSTITVRS